MTVVIDTSSLVSLVRYYLPFDKHGILYNLIKSKIEKGKIIILDAVLQECKFVSQKLVVNSLPYLFDKEVQKEYKFPLKTEDLLPLAPTKFLAMLQNQFIANHFQFRKLDDVEFEVKKKEFMESADAKLIMHCQYLIKDFPDEIFLVTEETSATNDLKLFKKIPAICKILEIPVLTLPDLLKRFPEVDLGFDHQK